MTTNLPFLENELMDVVRLFPGDGAVAEHVLSYADGTYKNTFTAGGKTYEFEDTMPAKNELEYKRYAKRYAKLALYKILKERYGMAMPWGALTGIRPTKLAYTERAAGRDWQTLFRKMDVSEENIRLTKEVVDYLNDEENIEPTKTDIQKIFKERHKYNLDFFYYYSNSVIR